MRLRIWDSYTPDTSLLLYPAYSGFLLNSFSRSSRYECRPGRPCPPPPPPGFRNGRSRFLNNGLNWRSVSDNSRNSSLTFFDHENQNQPEEEESITDIIIPMTLYLYNFFEPNFSPDSTSPIFYSKYYSLYHLWSNYLVH